MQQPSQQPTRTLRWGAPASVAVHALVLALLVFGLPSPLPDKPDEPEAIDVELVAPPEPEPQEEEQQPKEQTAQEEQAQEPAPPSEQPADAEQAAVPRPALRPVFQFGEQDAGPRLAEDGNAATEEQAPSEEETEPAEPDTADAVTIVPEPNPPVALAEARTLYSQSEAEALAAMRAMDGMPRDRRAGELCVTEMREQLRHADPPFWPDLLPSYRLAEGTAMEVRKAAFRAGGQWYDLAFRCEVDDDVTRIVSFAFSVGAAIPRSEWARRGFPAS